MKIPEYESTTGQLLGVESVGEHPHPSVQRAAKSSSRSNIGLLPDLVSYSNEGLPLAQGYDPFMKSIWLLISIFQLILFVNLRLWQTICKHCLSSLLGGSSEFVFLSLQRLRS